MRTRGRSTRRSSRCSASTSRAPPVSRRRDRRDADGAHATGGRDGAGGVSGAASRGRVDGASGGAPEAKERRIAKHLVRPGRARASRDRGDAACRRVPTRHAAAPRSALGVVSRADLRGHARNDLEGLESRDACCRRDRAAGVRRQAGRGGTDAALDVGRGGAEHEVAEGERPAGEPARVAASVLGTAGRALESERRTVVRQMETRMMSDSTGLVAVSASGFPTTYEQARVSIVTCARIDECKSWADKMAAMESYARQKKDESMEVAAREIRHRAERRYGELLRELDAEEAARNAGKQAVISSGSGDPGEIKRPWGSEPKASTKAAAAAGITPQDAKTGKQM